MRSCARCGAAVLDDGHRHCWSCTHEKPPQLPLTPAAPPCPRCGKPLASDADLSLLAAEAYAACYRPSTFILPVIKDNLRALVRGYECRLGVCRKEN